MKKSNLLFIVISFIITGIISCDDARLDYISDPSVYFPKSGEIEQIIYKTGEPFIYRLGVYKSGINEMPAYATIGIMSEADLQTYNNENKTNYKKLPDNCFQLKGGENVRIDFSKNNRLEFVDINILYDEIEKIQDYNPQNSANYVVPVVLSRSDINVGETKRVSFIKVLTKDPFIYFKESESFLQMESAEDKYERTIDLVVDFTNTWDIAVELDIDEDLVEEYNKENGKNLKLLPAAAYSLSPNPLTIENEKNSARITITLNNDNVDYDDFLLPVSIGKVSKFAADSERDVHYLLVSRPTLRLDRTGWTIADFSSEEVSGEGEGQGVASCVLDGNAATFWHSRWAGATGQLPHHITIDMQKEVTVAGVDLQRRSNSKDTQKGNFYVSDDNQSFTQVGSFAMADTNEPQAFKINTYRGRYLKVEITESNRPPFANMAEIYVRGAE